MEVKVDGSFRAWMIRCMLIFSVCTFSFVSCSDHDDDEVVDATPSRTIIFYMVAENSLNNFLAADVFEIIQGAKSLSDNARVVLYVDDINKPRIYTIDNKTTATSLTNLVPEKEYDEDMNSASAETLSEYLNYVKRHHPSQNYGIVFWSHGSGWQTVNKSSSSSVNERNDGNATAAPALRFSFGIDNGRNDNSNNCDHFKCEMGIPDLAKAVEQFGKVDFIMFDCCFMQNVEVAYQLRNIARYIIASPLEIPSQGAPYDQIIPLMSPEMIDYQSIVDTYYNKYCNSIYGSVLSLVDTKGLPALATATATIYAKYKNTLEELDLSTANNYFNYDKCRHRRDNIYPDFYDMNSVMKLWLSSDDYTTWKKAFDSAVVYSRATDFFYSSFPGNNDSIDVATAGCITMFLPFQKYRDDYFIDSYFLLDWTKALGIYK